MANHYQDIRQFWILLWVSFMKTWGNKTFNWQW
jgi:hypothetical protein